VAGIFIGGMKKTPSQMRRCFPDQRMVKINGYRCVRFDFLNCRPGYGRAQFQFLCRLFRFHPEWIAGAHADRYPGSDPGRDAEFVVRPDGFCFFLQYLPLLFLLIICLMIYLITLNWSANPAVRLQLIHKSF
jgi:hypothetical protein